MLGAIHMVACLMPSVCVMICGGPGAQPASPYAWATPLKGVSPMHASNRPFGWPAADMRRHGLLPEGLPLRARALVDRPGVPDRHAIELQATKQDGPVRGAQVVRPPVAFWREILAKPQTQIVQGLEVRKK